MSPGPRLSTAMKAGLTAIAAVAVIGLAQAALVARGVPLWLALGAPLLAAPPFTWAYTRYVVGFRARALVAGFSSMAAGNLETQLPPAPDADLVPVRAAFDKMGASLRELTSRLRRADAERRRLFSDLAHELATPTSTLLGISEALATPALCSTEEERAWLLASFDHEATRLLRLIRDVRDLADLDDPDFRLEPEEVDVAELARKAVDRLNALGAGAASIRCRAGAARATVDPVRVDQILMNILTNAQRHAPAEGIIDLEVSRARGAVRIVVEDSGKGVPDALLPHLGERMFRADPSRDRRTGGHGLGLSIVRAIVERHRGALRFDRGRLGGLRVTCALPASDEIGDEDVR